MNKHLLIDAIARGTPRVHATGFAQLYLAPRVRLHVWTAGLFTNAPDMGQVTFKHDHRYAIVSYVLKGALMDEPFDMIAHYGPTGWKLYEVRPAHEGEPEKPHMVENFDAEVMAGVPRIIRGGHSYCIPKRRFHATRALEETVTVMRKVDEENTWARLLVPTGFNPIHSLERQPALGYIKDEMIRAVYRLGDGELLGFDIQESGR